MGKGQQKLRLDEILIDEGLVSEDQIKEALAKQKERGGKFGSHLLHDGYVDEPGLVKALAAQFNCDGVVLSKLEIPEIILKFIPRRLAIARKIVPFDYDLDNNLLKIACEDPNDESLQSEISFVARGKSIKLYIAAELALNTAIARYYMNHQISPEDGLLMEIPDEIADMGGSAEKVQADFEHTISIKSVLLVTDDSKSGSLVKSLLEQDNYHVVVTDSADDALEIIGSETFHTVFIKDTVSGDYLDLIDRLRKQSPSTVVRYYESTSSLLLNDDCLPAEESLLRKNLELYTYLLNAKDRLPDDHTCVMGRYVDMVCARMEIPYKDRLAIVNAAYIHDIARHYYTVTGDADRKQSCELTIKLLKSLGYSPVVVAILRSMYKNVKGKYTKRLPIEVLGGNILTAVDSFCRSFPARDRLSLDKLDSAQKKLRDQIGNTLLNEVVEAFIGLLKDEILKHHTEQNVGQIMLLSRVPELTESVEGRLKNEGFRVISTDSVSRFTELYERSRPDIVILAPDIEVSYITSFLDELTMREISFEDTATFILKDGIPPTMLVSLFELGIEDVIGTDGNFELLIAKICRIQSRIRSRVKHKGILGDVSGGAGGGLDEMNLSELMEELNTGQRTVKLTVTPADSRGNQLVVFFGYGSIVFARLDNLAGEDAIYRAAQWNEGTWTVETIKEEDLPDSNVERSDGTIRINTMKILENKPTSPESVP
ncbi:MAG: DUF4388 domain-containing protein [Candidatus Zixiibacteriota bacterium]|nr:MAG: DUF4388 domain-containing protein [candidate division Zixibacteria bacterium]